LVLAQVMVPVRVRVPVRVPVLVHRRGRPKHRQWLKKRKKKMIGIRSGNGRGRRSERLLLHLTLKQQQRMMLPLPLLMLAAPVAGAAGVPELVVVVAAVWPMSAVVVVVRPTLMHVVQSLGRGAIPG
jgi:hypothetical protein